MSPDRVVLPAGGLTLRGAEPGFDTAAEQRRGLVLGLGLARWERCPGDLANTLDWLPSAFRVLANERRGFSFFFAFRYSVSLILHALGKFNVRVPVEPKDLLRGVAGLRCRHS